MARVPLQTQGLGLEGMDILNTRHSMNWVTQVRTEVGAFFSGCRASRLSWQIREESPRVQSSSVRLMCCPKGPAIFTGAPF